MDNTSLNSISTTSAVSSKSRGKKKQMNPLESAIRSWYHTLPPEILSSLGYSLEKLLANAPKRWTVYPPMVLLPSGSFNSEWNFIFKAMANLSLIQKYRSDLLALILHYIGKREGKGDLTHLAINSGIPRYDLSAEESKSKKENILRTPSGLVPLFGDFGPALSPTANPSQEDFNNAFWVSTKQNGITQIWAPRYTMFSRGNIREKERLIKFHAQDSMKIDDLSRYSAVDLFAGIGYFIFSFVKMGIGKVFGWEINPWSVEGLRRGAVLNGWSIEVIRPGDALLWKNEKIVVFLEDNKFASEKLRQLQDVGNVKHVNCGLLPTSSESWKTALACVGSGGWLHLHENVGEKVISVRRSEIENTFKHWLDITGGSAKINHVELVKTFAPKVWHCVFDIYVTK